MTNTRDPSKAERTQPHASADSRGLTAPPTFAGSALADAARRAVDHFGGKDADADPAGAADPMELWGRRVGRALSLVACIGLGIYLYVTYLR